MRVVGMARLREFDEDKVLMAAADAFWSRGYEATTTRDLTEATGLSHSSLYAAYGDKRGIFLQALDHYLERILRERIRRLETTLPPRDAISGFFDEIIDRSLADARHRGCLLVNSALEATPEDPEIQKRVASETLLIENFFLRCIAAGQEAGDVPRDHPALQYARQFLAVLLGLRVLARVRPDKSLLLDLVRPALSSIGVNGAQRRGLCEPN